MLTCGSLSRPEIVWEKTWNYLAEDIIHKQQWLLDCPGLSISDDQIKNLTLLEIEKILLRNNYSSKRFNTMLFPNLESVDSANNRLIIEETSYDRESLQHEFDTLFVSLTYEQRGVYNEINKVVEKGKGGVFFIYGYGGTDKTFLWKTLASSVRSKCLIVLNVASSGIASLLLTGGRTAHSRFKIPINLTEDSICSFDPQSKVADLIKQTSLIIWDETPMIHKYAFEAMDRIFKDILKSDSLFGGKVVVFGGDFRQILPVITNGSRHQIVNASLSSSNIWKNCKVLKLTKNMRLTVGSKDPNIEETRLFAE
ncbi:ATP-dependent DNA helicase RRM3-like [Bidens hawaiensis]|uniref:ATP-dependent DNA helicase RRM3-like n=1 Tax=Bidens hawaiensis TaxID=980011 RepID=UPI004049DE50